MFRIALIVLATLFSTSASALVCNRISNGTQECFEGGRLVYQGPWLNGTPVLLISGGQQVVTTRQAAGINSCVARGTILGAVLGSFFKNYTGQAIVLGALAGDLIAEENCPQPTVRQATPRQVREVAVLEQREVAVGVPQAEVITTQQAYCEEKNMSLGYYRDVQQCLFVEGGTIIRVLSPKYRTVRVPATCRYSDGSVITGPECERRHDRDTQQGVSGNRTPVMNAAGKTCAALDRGGRVIYDFLADDSTNPLGKPVTTGAECKEAQARYKG